MANCSALHFAVWACLLVVGQSPRPEQRSGKIKALCSIDIAQALFRLGQAGLALKDAGTNCKGPLATEPAKAKCSANVNGILLSFSLAASMISGAASHCAKHINGQALCAADVTSIVGNLAVVAGVSSSMYTSCVPANRPPKKREQAFPKLQDFAPEQLLGPKRQEDIAKCFFDVAQGAAFIGRAAMAIDGAATTCQETTLVQRGGEGQRICSITIMGLLGAFSLAGRFLALAGNDCPIEKNVNSSCAADITGVIGGIIAVAAPATDLIGVCPEKEPVAQIEDEVVEPDRRLGASNSSALIVDISLSTRVQADEVFV